MPEIPAQLRNEKFRFIRVSANGKVPLDKGWTERASYAWDDSQLQQHLQNGGNYGVVTGDGLTVIDCDEQELVNLVREKLPETFSVKTGSGGMHFYYDCILPRKIILKKGDKHMGEVQSRGQQVIGPTCTHPNGNAYEIASVTPIALLDPAELRAAFADYFEEGLVEDGKNRLGYETDPVLDQIKSKLKVKDVLTAYGINTKSNPTQCPMHASTRGKCLSFKDNVWKCFHCEKGGNIFHLIQYTDNLSFSEAWKRAAEMSGINISSVSKIVEICDKEGTIVSDEIAAEKIRNAMINGLSCAGTKPEKGKVMFDARVSIVDYLLDKYTFITLLRGKNSEYWVYRDGIYVEDGDRLVRSFAEMAMGDVATNHMISEIMGHIQRRTLTPPDKFSESDKRYICLANGVYDTQDGVLLPHDSRFIFFNKLPVEYDANADCPEIKAFFDEVLDAEDVSIMQELIGYCMWRDYPISCVFFLSGGGANGKTVVSKVLRTFLGQENICSVSLQQLVKDKFMAIQLHNRLVNINPDISGTAMDDISIVKALTGGDLIMGQKKGKDATSFINYAKLIFGANEIPRIEENTDAWYRRVVTINFTNQYLPPVDYEARKDDPNVFLADPHIEEKLLTPQELSGLFNWAVKGLIRLLKNGQFSNPKTIEIRREEFLIKSDNFSVFAEDRIEDGHYTDYIIKQDLRTAYNAWCKEKKIKKPVSDNTIKSTLSRLFGAESLRGQEVDGIRPRVWGGIKWRPLSVDIAKKVDSADNRQQEAKSEKIGNGNSPPCPPCPPSPESSENKLANVKSFSKSRENMDRVVSLDRYSENPEVITMEGQQTE